jgi:proteasome lid subunit RPN8/RPN11
MTWRDEAIEHAKLEFPREACGLVVSWKDEEPVYMPCQNLAQNQKDFIMDPADLVQAEDAGWKVLRVFHSHPNAHATPSQADLVGCEASGLPWSIYALPGASWEEVFPSGYRAPIVGREYACGILDCYALIRDWYREVRGVELLDFERKEDSFSKGESLYMEGFRKTGFEPIDGPMEEGDVILMQIRAPVPNHGAIYLGRDLMLHHLANRLSSREVYGGYWRKCTRLVIRFKGLP